MVLGLMWYLVYRLWRTDLESLQQVGAEGIIGHVASQAVSSVAFPGSIAFTMLWLDLIALEVERMWKPFPAWPAAIDGWVAIVALLFLALGFWMWLFMWPRWLVPPGFRGEPGVVVAAWRSWRARRRAK